MNGEFYTGQQRGDFKAYSEPFESGGKTYIRVSPVGRKSDSKLRLVIFEKWLKFK